MKIIKHRVFTFDYRATLPFLTFPGQSDSPAKINRKEAENTTVARRVVSGKYNWVSALILITIGFISAAAQTPSSDLQFIQNTRDSYSMLKRQGLLEMKATVIPNWSTMLKEVALPDKAAAIRLASRLRFTVAADAKGNVHITHLIAGPKPGKATADALDNMAKGVELSITGFLMSWAPFMLTYLIPDNLDHFVIQDLEANRLLSFQERGIDVSVAITNDFEIKELRTPLGALKPILSRNKDGFVLTGYEGDNDDPVAGHVELRARIDSVLTQGMLLPRRVLLKGASGSTPINFELLFTNYRLKKRV